MATRQTYSSDNAKKYAPVTVTRTGVNLDGSGKMTNYGDGKFATQITPNSSIYMTGATLNDTVAPQNNGNGKFAATIDMSKVDKNPTQITLSNGSVAPITRYSLNDVSGGDGGNPYQAASVSSDPYASIYSLYEQQMNAQRDALEQQRKARLNALQANYNNAKNQLDSSFASGEAQMNQDADDALREAYISNMLNQRNMNQYLNGQGITGGAAESILANLYNTYGNNRNDIERGRMDNLRQLLANYQGTLGDIENSYLSGMADADSDYSGSIADALSNYYNNLASLQQQNIANQYKATLGKSGSSSSNSSNTADATARKNMVSTISKFKDDPEGLISVAQAYGIDYNTPEGQLLLLEGGVNPNILNTSTNTTNYAKALASVPMDVKNRLLSYLDQNRGQVYGDDAKLIAALQTFGKQNGLTEAQVKAILAEAGY